MCFCPMFQCSIYMLLADITLNWCQCTALNIPRFPPYDLCTRRQELGGREWTVDNNGELLVVDRQRGDTMTKTVVTALYSVRDVVPGDPAGGSDEARGGGGNGGGEEQAPAWGRGTKKRQNSSSSSSSSLRRLSASQRLVVGCVNRVYRVLMTERNPARFRVRFLQKQKRPMKTRSSCESNPDRRTENVTGQRYK